MTPRIFGAFVAVALTGISAGCAAPAAQTREVAVPAGTVLAARFSTSIGSDSSRVGDAVEATLTSATSVGGVDILPAGSTLTGIVTAADPSGKVSGRANLAVQFRSISISAPGREETYPLTAHLERRAESTTGDDAKKIGIPAAGGAVIGAVVGGKKGAGIGALIGGGAGTAVVLSTSGPNIHYASGATFSMALEQAIDVRMPIQR